MTELKEEVGKGNDYSQESEAEPDEVTGEEIHNVWVDLTLSKSHYNLFDNYYDSQKFDNEDGLKIDAIVTMV